MIYDDIMTWRSALLCCCAMPFDVVLRYEAMPKRDIIANMLRECACRAMRKRVFTLERCFVLRGARRAAEVAAR